MTIRRAKQEDLPALQVLLQQILLVHHEARPDLFKPEGSKFTDEALSQLIDNDQKPIFVYEDERGQILGHLFCIIEVSESATAQPIKTLFIDDLCVDENARGRHIGEQLYQFACSYAKELGCYNLTLHVWNANQGALRFYERQGLKAQYTAMEKILSNDD